VTVRGASVEPVVEARIGAADAEAVVAPEVPTPVEHAARTPLPAPAASTPKIRVRLRMVTILAATPVMTMRTPGVIRHRW
jgi:hypothetical protein